MALWHERVLLHIYIEHAFLKVNISFQTSKQVTSIPIACFLVINYSLPQCYWGVSDNPREHPDNGCSNHPEPVSNYSV